MGDKPSKPVQGAFLRRVAGGLVAAVFIAYPLLVYAVLKATTVRWASLVLLLGLLPIILRTTRTRDKRQLKRPLVLVALVLALLAAGSVVNSMQPLLFVPVVVNSSFLLGFGHTLISGPPLIERFARLQHPDLTTAEVRWCKQWTVVWCGFFALNIVVAAVLASLHELAWWTVYNGLVSYVIMGLLFSVEYVVRRYRFGRLSEQPWDRLLDMTFRRLRENGSD